MAGIPETKGCYLWMIWSSMSEVIDIEKTQRVNQPVQAKPGQYVSADGAVVFEE